MLEIEKRYQTPHAAFQKYEKIRIEQWVRGFDVNLLVQEAMSCDLEPAMEEKQEFVRYVVTRPNPEQEARKTLHQNALR